MNRFNKEFQSLNDSDLLTFPDHYVFKIKRKHHFQAKQTKQKPTSSEGYMQYFKNESSRFLDHHKNPVLRHLHNSDLFLSFYSQCLPPEAPGSH